MYVYIYTYTILDKCATGTRVRANRLHNGEAPDGNEQDLLEHHRSIAADALPLLSDKQIKNT